MIIVLTQIGVISPPVGINVYVVSGMEKKSFFSHNISWFPSFFTWLDLGAGGGGFGGFMGEVWLVGVSIFLPIFPCLVIGYQIG
jgi:hypothetical protein